MTPSSKPTPPLDSAATSDTLAGLRLDRTRAKPRKRRIHLWVIAGLAIAAIAAALLIPRRPTVQAGVTVRAFPSQQLAELTASGYVVAQRRAAVSSKTAGRLVALTVREGSVVTQGELIGRVDPSDVMAALAVGQSAVNQARAAQAQSAATLGQATAELTNAETELARQQAMNAEGFVSDQAVDTAKRRLLVAKSVLVTQQAAVRTAQASVAQAQAQMDVQKVNQAGTDIRAPFSGVVLVKNANVGDMITPFSSAVGTLGSVVTLADLGTLEVEADVSESSVARLKAGQPVEITLDAMPEVRFRGRVARIVPTVDRAKATVMTKISFEALDSRILPEMSAKVSFLSRAPSADEQKPVIAVNANAVVERGGRSVVFRLDADNRVEAIPVQRGRNLGEMLELTSPLSLKPGDRVVLQPPASLDSGAAVALAGSR